MSLGNVRHLTAPQLRTALIIADRKGVAWEKEYVRREMRRRGMSLNIRKARTA